MSNCPVRSVESVLPERAMSPMLRSPDHQFRSDWSPDTIQTRSLRQNSNSPSSVAMVMRFSLMAAVPV